MDYHNPSLYQRMVVVTLNCISHFGWTALKTQPSGNGPFQITITNKKILSAEPADVGRLLLSKFLILTFTRVNIGLRRKCVIQKL